MKLSKKPYRGTRDFFPDDMRVRDYIFNKMHETARLFGYQHYDGPILEEVELYKAKSGEEIINDQIYSFTDRGERFVAIRPEMTPTIARMVAQVHREIPRPIRWYSIPNLMRYEKPQRGRLREHWQFNIDIFGAPTPYGEIEILKVGTELLKSFGATSEHFNILINDREIVSKICKDLFKLNEDESLKLFKLIDKSKKMESDKFDKLLDESFKNQSNLIKDYLSLDSFKALKDFLNKHKIQEFDAKITDFIKITSSSNIEQYIQFDPAIIRGLDYYTGIVFEFFDKSPENRRAISGGGQYKNLLQIFNEPELPGVGLGLGDVTLTDFLKTHELLPDLSKANIDILLTKQTEDEAFKLEQLAMELRANKFSVQETFDPVKFKKVFHQAEKLGCKFVILYGDQEKSANQFIIKNLEKKEQKEFHFNEIKEVISFLKK